MRVFASDFRRRVAVAVTVWMTVMGCGVSISHTHAAGSAPHCHGFGWTVSFDARPAQCPGHSDSPTDAHRHLILFGIEFPGESVQDAATSSVGDVQKDMSLEAEGDPAESVLCHADIDVVAGHVPFDARALPSLYPPIPLSADLLSAVARRAVAGVLRS